MNPKIIVENSNAIYSFPEVTLKIKQLIHAKEYSNTDFTTLILCDPALTAQILRLANSSCFGFSREIDTVSRAISIIGKENLHNLILATSDIQAVSDISSTLASMESFWYHSFACGVITHLLAVKMHRMDKERFFIAGLLHAIGKLVLLAQYPNESTEVFHSSDLDEEAVITTERKIFGFTHVELGAELLKQWQLPASIWRLVKSQSDPLNTNTSKIDSTLLHVAISMASNIEPLSCQAQDYKGYGEIIPRFNKEAWKQLGLKTKIIHPTMAETSLKMLDILAMIKPEVVTIY